jgi:TIR domain-containing protein
MARQFNSGEFRRRLRAAQRQAEQQVRREVNRFNRELQSDARRVDRHNQRTVNDYNRRVDAANRHNQQVVSRLNQQLVAASRPRVVSYTVEERQLVDRVQEATLHQDEREYDIFLSYARLDGSEVAEELRDALINLGVSVWHDELGIKPGWSQALQMDRGLRCARAGVALLTPVYLTGRFWTERELGALLHKATLIPVLHNVTFADVKEYSGILPDLAGFTTDQDSVAVIAEKIADAVTTAEAA